MLVSNRLLRPLPNALTSMVPPTMNRMGLSTCAEQQQLGKNGHYCDAPSPDNHWHVK